MEEVEVELKDKITGYPAVAAIYVYMNPENKKDVRGRFKTLIKRKNLSALDMARIKGTVLMVMEELLSKLTCANEKYEVVKANVKNANDIFRNLVGFGPAIIKEE